MQKKKNIQLIISLSLMILVIVVLFIFSSTNTNSSVDKAIFQIENLEKIDHIILESSNGKTELKFDGVKWLVDGKHEADRQMITILFATLKQVEAKRKVAAALKDSIQKEIVSSGMKVSCYEGQSLVKEFWSKGNQQNSETYFQLNKDVPYLVGIPGYRVYVASVFEVPVNDWRDKRVFTLNWQNVKSVDVSFPSNSKQGFRASFQNRIFSIEGISQTDTTKLASFMDALIQLRADRILSEEQANKYDSLLVQKPMAIINVQDIASRSYELKIFPIVKGKRVAIAKRRDDLIELNLITIKDVFKSKDYFALKSSIQ